MNTAFGTKQGLEDQHALGGASLFVPHTVGALTAKGPESLGAPEVDGNHYIVSSGQPVYAQEVADPLTANEGKTYTHEGKNFRTRNVTAFSPDVAEPIVFDETQITHPENRSRPEPGDDSPTLQTDAAPVISIPKSMIVRRLTPTECERLQGFPDGYTDIPGASDSVRYKALGNSMAVPVMRWIGERIERMSR